MNVQRFQDLIAWQKARVLAAEVYRCTSTGTLARDYGLRDQRQRAATSIMGNIAEGFERRSSADFARFLTISKASCAELQLHLFLALDVGYLDSDQFQRLQSHSDEVSRIIAGLRSSLGTGN